MREGRRLSSAPLALYVRGSVEALSRWPTVAVVGTRRASAYALRATERWPCSKFGLVAMNLSIHSQPYFFTMRWNR